MENNFDRTSRDFAHRSGIQPQSSALFQLLNKLPYTTAHHINGTTLYLDAQTPIHAFEAWKTCYENRHDLRREFIDEVVVSVEGMKQRRLLLSTDE